MFVTVFNAPSTPEITTVFPGINPWDVDVVKVPTKFVMLLEVMLLEFVVVAVDATLADDNAKVNVFAVGVATTSCAPLNVESTL